MIKPTGHDVIPFTYTAVFYLLICCFRHLISLFISFLIQSLLSVGIHCWPHKMSWEMFFFSLVSEQLCVRLVLFLYLSFWFNSLLKPIWSGIYFMGRFQIIYSDSSTNVEILSFSFFIFIFFIQSW